MYDAGGFFLSLLLPLLDTEPPGVVTKGVVGISFSKPAGGLTSFFAALSRKLRLRCGTPEA
jgi:hypothetical protein